VFLKKINSVYLLEIKKEMYFPSGSHAHDPEASAQFEADRAHRVESFQRQFKLRLGQAA